MTEERSPKRLTEVDFDRLVRDAGLHLRLRRMQHAAETIDALLQNWPQSTIAHELAGDLATARGQAARARAEYKQAMELEPANSDAEYKYGLALTTTTAAELQSEFVAQVIADPDSVEHGSTRKPMNAVLNAMLFPGLGQLYNREHEKGLACLCAAAVLLMLLFYLAVQMPFAMMAEAAHGGHRLTTAQQIGGLQETLTHMGGGHWTLIILCLLGYTGLYFWGIYDAWRQAEGQHERQLGIRR